MLFYLVMDKCYIDGCECPAKYCIEWYGVNQHGGDPLVADERPVCGNMDHIVSASAHDDYGGTPDGIVDIKTYEIEHPELLEKVIKLMEERNLIF